jgi:cell division protein FtsI (penicillin-binding protein 3)
MLVPSERLHSAMTRQFRQEPPRMPRRGYILDRNKEPIAVSMEVKSLFANPGKVKNVPVVATQLAKVLKLPVAQVRQRLQGDRAFVWIKRQLSETEQAAVEDVLEKNPAYGLFLGLSKESKRFYPHQSLASQLMGFTGLDSNGLEGVELFQEKELAGERREDGKQRDGRSLVLTIDRTLQHTLEEELARGLKESGGIAATGIVMDAATGDVVAMASAPTFNANKFGASTGEHRRNRSVTDTYEPGSTLKTMLVAAALEEGTMTAQNKVFCEFGKFQVGKHWIKESEAKKKWGWLTPGEVLQHSSNVGAAKIGFLLGPEKMDKWYRNFGFAERSGVDLPGEAPGSMARPEKWSKILQSNIAFGHGLTTTPLQVARAYAAIANGGILVTPRLVKQVQSFEGDFLRDVAPGPRRRVISEKTARSVARMMKEVATDEGTAPKAAIPGFTVLGKTGTSQKPVPGKGYRSGKYMASFVGFVRDVNPGYVVYVMVDEPKFPYYGGEAAAPIFRRVMTAALAREGVSPDPALIPLGPIGQKKEEPRSPERKDVVRTLASAPVVVPALEKADDYWLMPDLQGLTARDVLDVFSGKDLKLRVKGAGLVTSQKPVAGALLKPGEVVAVRLERESVLP